MNLTFTIRKLDGSAEHLTPGQGRWAHSGSGNMSAKYALQLIPVDCCDRFADYLRMLDRAPITDEIVYAVEANAQGDRAEALASLYRAVRLVEAALLARETLALLDEVPA